MPIVDKSKLKRPEIFELRQKFLNQVNEAFFKSVVYTEDDYKPIWKKLEDLNERWLNGENVTNMLSMKEKLLLAENLRFYMECTKESPHKIKVEEGHYIWCVNEEVLKESNEFKKRLKILRRFSLFYDNLFNLHSN